MFVVINVNGVHRLDFFLDHRGFSLMTENNLDVRPIIRTDADHIAGMAREAVQYLIDLGDSVTFNLTRERYLADGFGADPAFAGFIAFTNEWPVGYLLYCMSYDSDHAYRVLMVIDLFVRADSRGLGVGKALLERAREQCRALGGKKLLWAVYKPNKSARDFYDRFGGRVIDWMDVDA
jgi:GNAT superfamily N-acetyltransferase